MAIFGTTPDSWKYQLVLKEEVRNSTSGQQMYDTSGAFVINAAMMQPNARELVDNYDANVTEESTIFRADYKTVVESGLKIGDAVLLYGREEVSLWAVVGVVEKQDLSATGVADIVATRTRQSLTEQANLSSNVSD